MTPIIDLITRGSREGGNLLAWNWDCGDNGDGLLFFAIAESEKLKEHM